MKNKTLMYVLGLGFLVFLSFLTKNEYVIYITLAYTFLVWGGYIFYFRFKQLFDSDMRNFKIEMKRIGLDYQGQVLVKGYKKEEADIVKDQSFRVSTDGGRTWRWFNSSYEVFVSGHVISRRSANERQDERLAFSKSTETYHYFGS